MSETSAKSFKTSIETPPKAPPIVKKPPQAPIVKPVPKARSAKKAPANKAPLKEGSLQNPIIAIGSTKPSAAEATWETNNKNAGKEQGRDVLEDLEVVNDDDHISVMTEDSTELMLGSSRRGAAIASLLEKKKAMPTIVIAFLILSKIWRDQLQGMPMQQCEVLATAVLVL